MSERTIIDRAVAEALRQMRLRIQSGEFIGPAGDPGADGSPGEPRFPYVAATYGTGTADDEEFDGTGTLAERGYTVVTDLASPHAYEINGTFSPSRLLVKFAAGTAGTLAFYRVPTEIDLSADFSMTFQMSGQLSGWAASGLYLSVLAGVRSDTTSTARAKLVGLSGDGVNVSHIRRLYTDLTLSPTDATAVLAGTRIPIRYYGHMQRVGTTWSYWTSADGSPWSRWVTNETDGNAVAGAYWMRIAITAAPTLNGAVAIDWIRWNRFFLVP